MTPTPKDTIIVVSGLPRSGTSLMMQILEKAGLPLLTDQLRTADLDNQRGYYEYEPVKFMKAGDLTWLELAKGKVVKVISHLLAYLPSSYPVKVIFMLRDLSEVVASQDHMLKNRGEVEKTTVGDGELVRIFEKHLQDIKSWIAQQPKIEVVYIDYNHLMQDPSTALAPLEGFLGINVTAPGVLSVVDPKYYRQRSGG